jgi:hypothetical protein
MATEPLFVISGLLALGTRQPIHPLELMEACTVRGSAPYHGDKGANE